MHTGGTHICTPEASRGIGRKPRPLLSCSAVPCCQQRAVLTTDALTHLLARLLTSLTRRLSNLCLGFIPQRRYLLARSRCLLACLLTHSPATSAICVSVPSRRDSASGHEAAVTRVGGQRLVRGCGGGSVLLGGDCVPRGVITLVVAAPRLTGPSDWTGANVVETGWHIPLVACLDATHVRTVGHLRRRPSIKRWTKRRRPQ